MGSTPTASKQRARSIMDSAAGYEVSNVFEALEMLKPAFVGVQLPSRSRKSLTRTLKINATFGRPKNRPLTQPKSQKNTLKFDVHAFSASWETISIPAEYAVHNYILEKLEYKFQNADVAQSGRVPV